MKISISNFKSIKRLNNFEIKPFTVISGNNSTGKSSFIQLLLILKQTVELDSYRIPFYLDGYLYKVNEYKDIIYNKNLKNMLKVSLEFNKKEASQIENYQKDFFNIYEEYNVSIYFQIDFTNETLFVREIGLKIDLPHGQKDQSITMKLIEGENYYIETNTALFGEGLWNAISEATVKFSSLYPSYYINNETLEKEFFKIDWIKNIVNSFLFNMYYIGPIRMQALDEYNFSRQHKNVGTMGENVAQILEEYAEQPTEFFKIIEKEEGITYQKEIKPLSEAVNYWMCEVFDVAKDIQSVKENETYKIILTSKSGLSTSIKHVGFGISQLLPIIVEALRMTTGGVLIVEQPEIHLHPKLQSLLYDFLYGLTLQGKSIIVETHSSHFITRMRRRIAEDKNNEMATRINLTFIENEIFKTIQLDDFGTLDYYPEDFIEQSNVELKSIVKAQMTKRKNK